MKTSIWVAHARIKPENPVNLLCFAYPGGSASYFAPWKRLLDERINLIPILYPEREVRKNDPMQESFARFIEEFVEQNVELFEKPYAFFGYCGGAVLAYEVAIRVRELTGKEPVWGMIASSEAPEYLRDSLVAGAGKNGEKDLVEYLLELGMFDENVLKSEMFLQYYIPMLKADCKMLDTYVYKKHDALHCNLDVLYGKEDKGMLPEKTEKWREITDGTTRVDVRVGGHFFVDTQKDYVCGLINERLVGEMP